MKLWIAGGCAEHGRNCFLLEGSNHNLMVDCGIMAGTQDPMPRLTRAQIARTKYVFLTHSHKDHTGAAEWLLENGFEGQFILSAETARQLPFLLNRCTLLPIPEKVENLRLDDIKLRYGMSGHCSGALWYWMLWEDKRLLFSGDFHFYSEVYECTTMQNHKADLAVIDSCYPDDEISLAHFTDRLEEILASTKQLLLPVPRFGRGLELMLLLIRRFPRLNLLPDSHLQSELRHIKTIKKWLRPDAYDTLRSWKANYAKKGTEVLLLSDAQLSTPTGRLTATRFAQEGLPILLSGNVEAGSYAQALLSKGEAECCILPIHNADAECKMLKQANHFKKIIPFHSTRWDSPRELEL